MHTIKELYGGNYVFNLEEPKDSKHVYTGIELEIEGIHFGSHTPTGWHATEDSSLRGSSCEIVLKEPKLGANLLANLKRVYQVIDNYRSAIIPSARTSTHIHLNVMPKYVHQVIHTYLMFIMFEPLLFALHSPRGRYNSVFCTETTPGAQIAWNALNKYINQGYSKSTFKTVIHQITNSDAKYFATNLSSLPKYGTIEIRIFPLILQEKELYRILDVLYAIYNHAMREESFNEMEYFSILRTQDTSLLYNKIFKDVEHCILDDVENRNSLLLRGIRNIAPIIFHEHLNKSFFNWTNE